MNEKDKGYFFYNGAIPASLISTSIEQCHAVSSIGAYSIFLGQVRADKIDDQLVSSIYYTAYEDMALEKLEEIKTSLLKIYPLIEIAVYHSLGAVQVGEVCLFVMTTAAHRRAAMDACNELVERIKAELPIWGKEYFNKEEYQWKTNK